MDSHDLEQQLISCLADKLRQRSYAPPRTPDRSITDAYYDTMARALLARIKADGWGIALPACLSRDPGGLTKPSDMTQAKAEEDLQQCLRIALIMFRHKPPQSRKQEDWDRYFGWAAESVVRSLRRSNWELAERTLQKLPPAQRHSTWA